MSIGGPARAVIRLAVVLLLLSAFSAVWELLALQAPGSPFSLRMLPGPVGHLRDFTATLALALLAIAWLIPWAYGNGEPRLMVWLCHAGAILTVGASFYGAIRGMYLVQIVDPRLEANVLLALKCSGGALLLGCLLEVSRRILFRPPPP
jgi:hypothetical protein